MGGDDAAAAIRQAAARITALGESSPRPAPDAVNLPMIRHWVQAMGDSNPVYTDAGSAAQSVHGGLVAPPAMAQVWTMRGLRPASEDAGDPLGLMSAALDEAGFTSVVATNSEQEYYRYLRLGEHLTVRSSLEEVTGPKRTALGEGWFVTTRSTWYVGTEAVASMRFRILKFRPHAAPEPQENPELEKVPDSRGAPESCGAPESSGAPELQEMPELQEPPGPPEPQGAPELHEVPELQEAAGPPEPQGAPEPPERASAVLRLVPPPEPTADVLRPVISPDTAFFWEGTARHELRIQRCGGCGTLRHPPGPMCPVCGFARPEYDVAAGTGEIYSYVVHHHPPVPGRQLPVVIALVQLTEGVRMVGELVGADPGRVRIGMPVHVTFVQVDGELTLPAWQEDQR